MRGIVCVLALLLSMAVGFGCMSVVRAIEGHMPGAVYFAVLSVMSFVGWCVVCLDLFFGGKGKGGSYA